MNGTNEGLYGVVSTDIRPSINPAPVGENVTFHISPLMQLKSGVWSFGSKTLVVWIGLEEQAADSRASVNTTTGVLTLRSVTVGDSGLYKLQSLDPQFLAEASLTVLEPVSNVTVSVSISDPVEFNDTVTLTCSASGSSLYFQWRNVSSDITGSENVELKDDNRTLVIPNILRFDRGPFYCAVFNGISNASSTPQYLKISYGPDGMQFMINGSQKDPIPAGSNLTLSCSAQSSPPAQFQWSLNGKLLNRTSPELELKNVQENHSGNYTCWAHNRITRRYSSLTEAITIKSHSQLLQPTILAVTFLSFLLSVVLQ
ncbi:hypothetical protein COCON_G00003880 [Conger conger]|uniref:Ig-like domain-containing protein n=1 Tax=Conger conger TaxID=82655 RepID=A0A9Q1I7I8_CONCO|nr:hypothetical protein COCON_G00003880 [Conger conger]